MKKTSGPPKGSGTKPIPGAHTDPESVPTPARGGDNSRGTASRQGKGGQWSSEAASQAKALGLGAG